MDALIRDRALRLSGVELRSAPHPGQRYRHGWIPVALTADDVDRDYGDELDRIDFSTGSVVARSEGMLTIESDSSGGVEVHAAPSPAQAQDWADLVEDGEGAAHGLSVTTEPSGARSLLWDHGDDEFVVPSDEVDAFAEALRDLAYVTDDHHDAVDEDDSEEPDGSEEILPDDERAVRDRQLRLLGIEERSHPHPGQRYRHGWIPVGPAVQAADAAREAAVRLKAAFGKVDTKVDVKGAHFTIDVKGQPVTVNVSPLDVAELALLLVPGGGLIAGGAKAVKVASVVAKIRRALLAAKAAELAAQAVSASRRHRDLLLLGVELRSASTEDQYDDRSAALWAAMHVFDEMSYEDRRAASWHPLDHPHFPPGTPGGKGGEFRPTIVSRVLAALSDWARGDGPNDPFDGFERAHLVKVAKERGLTVPPRATYKQVADLLLDDVRGLVKQGRIRERPDAKFTLQGPDHRDVDVAVFRPEGSNKPVLYKVTSSGQTGAKFGEFQDLDALHAWAQEHDEPRLAEWADQERIGKAARAKKAAPKRAPFSVGEPISARDKRRLGAVDEADQPRVRDRAQELYGPDKTRAAAWMQALNEHEASKPAKKAAPAKAATPAKRAPRPLNEQEQALLDQIATFSFHNSVITRPERKPTVNRQLDRLIAHGYLREENGQLHITDDGRRAAGQAPRSAPAKAAPVRRLTAAQKVARSEKSRTQRPPGYPERESVPAGKASWSSSYPGYDPPVYTAQSVLDNDSTVKPGGWADPADVSLVDHDFTSYEGTAKLDAEGRPLNPYTRTGIQDRGLLGKWGANFAADPIVTRINPDTGRLEMATIQRGEPIDGVHQWAIPGGMVDEGESVSVTLGREFREETGADLDLSTGREIYKGYVDDPRNTDNAWMETTAVHRHLSTDEAAAVKFKGPDDPGEIRDIRWAPVDADFMAGLYASHGDFVAEAVRGLLADDSTDLSPDARRSLEAAIARPPAPAKAVRKGVPPKPAAPEGEFARAPRSGLVRSGQRKRLIAGLDQMIAEAPPELRETFGGRASGYQNLVDMRDRLVAGQHERWEGISLVLNSIHHRYGSGRPTNMFTGEHDPTAPFLSSWSFDRIASGGGSPSRKAAPPDGLDSPSSPLSTERPNPDGLDSTGARPSHLRTTEPPITSSSTRIVPTPTPPNPQSPWGKVRDEPRWEWSPAHGRMGNLDQIDRVYTAPTREDARRFLASMDNTRLQDIADHVEDMINVRGLTAERDHETLIDRLVDGIREPEASGLDSIDEPARPAKVPKVADGLDDMPEHRLRSWAQEFEIPGARTKSPAVLKRELRKQGIGGPEVEQAKRRAEIDVEREAEKLAQMRNPWNGPPSSGSGVGRDVGIYTWEAVDPAYKAAPEDAVFDVPDSEVRQAVEDAWFELTGGRDGKWAKLADLREKIGPKYPFEQVNRVLLHLSREPGSDLIGELMQQHLTTRDRDARVNIGNQPRHMLMFEADKAKRIRAEHAAARPAPEAAARTRQSSIDSARRVADTLAEIAELQDSGASPAAMEARINGQRGRGLPDADADRLVAAVQGGGRSHLRTTEPPVTSSSTPIVPTPTPPNPQSAWGKIRDDPRWAWSSVHGRMGNLDQIDRVYTAPTTEDARRFLDSMGDGRLQDVADHVEDVINVRGLTAERDRDALIDRLVTGIREPESGGDVAQVQADLARDHNLSPTSTVGETSFFNPATMTMAGSPPVEGSGTQVRVVRPGYSVVVDGETVQLSKAVVEVVPAVPRKAASKRPPLDLDAVSTRLAAAPDEASIVMALDGLLMPELRKVAREFNMGLPSDLVKEEGSAPYLVPKRLTADELRQYIAKAMIEGRSKFKWR